MTNQKPKAIAFIPARSGSKRLPNKNIKNLGGHPLLAYSIRVAIESGVFDTVVCATDSELYATIAKHYGAEVPLLRSHDISGDKSPDVDWVVWMLKALKKQGREFQAFSILRPTSPFRKVETIQRAWDRFVTDSGADSLRAVEKCKQHPGKMWVIRGDRMLPLLPFANGVNPWHSSQYGSLPEVYVQNASLEIAWTHIALNQNTIAGEVVIPFISEEFEGFDINDYDDWFLVEQLIAQGDVKLLNIEISPFK